MRNSTTIISCFFSIQLNVQVHEQTDKSISVSDSIREKDHPIRFQTSITEDFVRNFDWGIKTGNTYLIQVAGCSISVTELTYKVQLGKKLFIQPDLQHILINLGLFPD